MSEAESWLLHLVPDEGRLALDVGANEGSFTELLADRFAEVHAFDPNPQITPVLRQRFANGRVRLMELAVYREPAVLTLNLYPGSEHATAYPQLEVMERGRPGGQVLVPATALDLLGYDGERLHVDFVKVDVEGGEADVLVGAKRTIRTHRPKLLIEIHNLDNLAFCQKILPSWGYEVEHIPHPHPGVHPGHCWLSAKAAVAAQKGA